MVETKVLLGAWVRKTRLFCLKKTPKNTKNSHPFLLRDIHRDLAVKVKVLHVQLFLRRRGKLTERNDQRKSPKPTTATSCMECRSRTFCRWLLVRLGFVSILSKHVHICATALKAPYTATIYRAWCGGRQCKRCCGNESKSWKNYAWNAAKKNRGRILIVIDPTTDCHGGESSQITTKSFQCLLSRWQHTVWWDKRIGDHHCHARTRTLGCT